MNKKAVSLMVSYVILISIAIGLSIGVYAWTKSYTNIFQPKVDCKSGTSLFLDDYTYYDEAINLSLKNNGLFNISGFIISASNDSSKAPIILLNATGAGTGFPSGHYYFSAPLNPGGISEAVFNGTNITIIQIQPFIRDEKGNKVMCEQSVIKQEIKGFFNILSLPGFVSWWKFDETSGITARDSVGNNDGTLNNMSNSDWVVGKSGNALDFDGIDDLVNISDDASLKFGTGDFSVGMWVKTSQTVGAGAYPIYIAKDDEQAPRSGWAIFQNGDQSNEVFFTVLSSGTEALADSNTAVNDGKWHYIVGVKTSNLIKIFIDKVPKSNLSHSLGSTDKSVPVDIGNHLGTPNRAFNNTIDEVMIFNRSLNQEEISNIYDSYS